MLNDLIITIIQQLSSEILAINGEGGGGLGGCA